MDSGRFRKWIIIVQNRTWITIVRKPRLLEMVWSTITHAELSLQFLLIGPSDIACEQNTA